MKLDDAIDRLCAATRADGRSLKTVKAYRDNLGWFADYIGHDVDVESITVDQLREYAVHLHDRTARRPSRENGGLSAFSVATYLRSVRRLFSFLVEDEIIAKSPARRIRIPRPKRREPKAISLDDIQKLLEATSGDALIQLRDYAIIMMLADTGSRVGGLAGLRMADLDLDDMTATVIEKGEKSRKIFYTDATRRALERWISSRPADAADWLFLNLGVKGGDRLTEVGIGQVLRRLGVRAGVTGPHGPHSFRHSFAREYLKNGGDLASLSKILGHSDAAITAQFYAIFLPDELASFHGRFSPVANEGFATR